VSIITDTLAAWALKKANSAVLVEEIFKRMDPLAVMVLAKQRVQENGYSVYVHKGAEIKYGGKVEVI
jgi:hypothetical protein